MKGCPPRPHPPPPSSRYWVSVLKIRDMNLIYPSINNSDVWSEKDRRISEPEAGAQSSCIHFQGHDLRCGASQTAVCGGVTADRLLAPCSAFLIQYVRDVA